MENLCEKYMANNTELETLVSIIESGLIKSHGEAPERSTILQVVTQLKELGYIDLETETPASWYSSIIIEDVDKLFEEAKDQYEELTTITNKIVSEYNISIMNMSITESSISIKVSGRILPREILEDIKDRYGRIVLTIPVLSKRKKEVSIELMSKEIMDEFLYIGDL